MRLRLRYASHEPCDVSAPKVMNTDNAALYPIYGSSTKFGLIHLWHSLCDNLGIGEINHKNERATPRQKMKKSWRARVTYSEKFHIYIRSERLYVAHLRNITLPFRLGIHDDANQTSGGRTPSFSIFTSYLRTVCASMILNLQAAK